MQFNWLFLPMQISNRFRMTLFHPCFVYSQQFAVNDFLIRNFFLTSEFLSANQYSAIFATIINKSVISTTESTNPQLFRENRETREQLNLKFEFVLEFNRSSTILLNLATSFGQFSTLAARKEATTTTVDFLIPTF